jgi:RNase P subunit RPR2
MKIIHRGEVKPSTCRVVCGRCKSELEVSESDGSYVSDQRDGDYIEVSCPVCNKTMTISMRHFQ